jgi:hypothetical protein
MTPYPHRATTHAWRGRSRTLAVAAAFAILLLSLAGWAAGKGKHSADKTKQTDAAADDEETPAAKADSVRISIQTVPPRKAQVKWGGKLLGVIPVPSALVVVRPRDSGPLDLVIRAPGFLPVHTRAYTFTDSRVAVKVTPPSEKSKLFGYREEPTANPDGGAPEPVPSATPSPTTPAP